MEAGREQFYLLISCRECATQEMIVLSHGRGGYRTQDARYELARRGWRNEKKVWRCPAHGTVPTATA